MGKKRPLNWEFSGLWIWAAFGKEKPFPVAVHRKGGGWSFTPYPHGNRELSNAQLADLEKLAAELQDQIEAQWADALSVRLNWPNLELRSTGDSGTEDDAAGE